MKGQLNILIVDETMDARQKFRKHLLGVERSYNLVARHCKQTAIRYCLNEHPSCIFLTGKMAEEGSLSFINEIRSHSELKSLPVIIITDAKNKSAARSALYQGASDYLIKEQLNENALWQAISKLIHFEQATTEHDRVSNIEIPNGVCNPFQTNTSCTIKLIDSHSEFKLAFDNELSEHKKNNQELICINLAIDDFDVLKESMSSKQRHEMTNTIAIGLQACLKTKDIISSFENGRFTIVITHTHGARDIEKIVNKMIHVFDHSVHIGNKKTALTCHLGVAVFPQTGDDSAVLEIKSEEAMLAAKGKGKNKFVYFPDIFSQEHTEKTQLIEELKKAISENAFRMAYQPKYNLITRKLVGIEALLRWYTPTLKTIRPDIFIPIAEETGLIIGIGNWVINKVFDQMKNWKDEGIQTVPIAINLSPKQLQSDTFIQELKEQTARYQIDPSEIELELTETTIVENLETTKQRLNDIKKLGFSLAIDDFGTGYSSLSYLCELPVSTLKIDREFVNKLENRQNAFIVKTILNLAKNLDLNTVAEGVENEKQANWLLIEGCQEVQGYYFSKPVSGIEIKKLLG